MTVTTTPPAGGVPAEKPADHVTVTVDGVELTLPKGTLVIRAAELIGVAVPRFCDHPLLDPVAACRMCLVEIEGQGKPQPACAITVNEGMVVRTQVTSEMADTAQRGVMEFLLINHPLDCPICDKGGECPLQNQAMSNGRGESRFEGSKRTFPKPIEISKQVLLDRERCVSCARCTRFADQIAGDAFIELLERGAKQQVGISGDQPFNSYYSGNTIQICPVGALTSAAYRFRSRPFDLISTPTVCEHCASGCGLRTDSRRSTVMRRLAWDTPEVNEEWNCDKGRFAFPYLSADRLAGPLLRDPDGTLRPASWPEALDAAARGLSAAAASSSGTAVLTGGRLTREDAYAYSVFARTALRTDDVDFRVRAHSAEETAFLSATVAGSGLGVTYDDLEKASTVVLVAFEPEDESPIVLLRLRKTVRTGSLKVYSVASHASVGLDKVNGTLLAAAPGAEAGVVAALSNSAGDSDAVKAAAAALREPGAIVLVGERAAASAGLLTEVSRLVAATGARLAWVPRRAGDRGAVDAGLLPGLLPGGRSLTDPQARAEVAASWGVATETLPAAPGRGTAEIVASAGSLGALVIAGVDPVDTGNAEAFLAAVEAAPFVVSLETRATEVSARADVVFPVAVVAEKSGSFTDWEGRIRPFGAVFHDAMTRTDAQVLAMLLDAWTAYDENVPRSLGRGDVAGIRQSLESLGSVTGDRPIGPDSSPEPVADLAAGQAIVASHRLLLDLGVLQQGEPHLAATARTAIAHLSAATADEIGAVDGGAITVSIEGATITLPLAVRDMPDRVVWLPMHSDGASVSGMLRAGIGAVANIAAASSARGQAR